ncbi:hypothetical protein C8J56DRAFT_1063653 [Mycena floridula]|nr:hypothetical protein C8J56DRAFT_1063653 [Mycena floridula]
MSSSLNHKLHADVLSEIFHHCVLHAHTKTLGTAGQAPLVLCWVCKPWRSAALSSPRLWTRLDFNPRIWKKKGVVELAECWLKRSGTLPIQFSLCWPYDSFQYIAAVAVMNRLVQDISRWQGITFSQERQMQEKVVWALPLIPFGSEPLALTSASLTLNPATSWTQSHWQWFLSVIADTQNLRSFTVDCPKLLRPLSTPSRLTTTNMRHLLNLTHLSVGNMSPSRVIDTIRLLSRLEYLQARLLKNGVSPMSETPPIMHPNLQILHLTDATGEFLNLLTLPSLRDLTLIKVRAEGHWPQASFESLMERSSSKFTTLTIQYKDITVADIIRCIQLPYLEHFRLGEGETRIPPPIIKRFSWDDALFHLVGVSVIVWGYAWLIRFLACRIGSKPEPAMIDCQVSLHTSCLNNPLIFSLAYMAIFSIAIST